MTPARVREEDSLSPSQLMWWLIGNRLVLLLLVFAALMLYPDQLVPGTWQALPKHPFFDGWIRWDAGWYHQIARQGYDNLPSNGLQRDTAFFPLFPLLTQLLGKLIGDFGVAGLLIANLSCGLACVTLYRLTRRRFGSLTAERTLLLLLFYPFSFYLTSMHTEPLFLFLVVAAFDCADKKEWLRAALFAAAASATRSVGVLVGIGVLLSYLEAIKFDLRRVQADILYLLLCPVGLLSHMLFLWKRFGDPLQFVKSQVAPGWAGSFLLTDPPTQTAEPATLASLGPRLLTWIGGNYGLLLALGALLILLGARRKLPLSYLAWSVLTIVVSLSSRGSLGRFLIVIFPVFVAAASYRWPRRLWLVALSLGGVLLAALSVYQALGHWVAG